MKKNILKKIYLVGLIVITITSFGNAFANQAIQKQNPKIKPGIYILVSFSMNNQSLRSYFSEAQEYGAKLVMRGLSGDKNSRNRFAATKEKAEKAKINFDINPMIFEELNITQVPSIIIAKKDGSFVKIAGHISLNSALDMMKNDIKKEDN